MASCGLETDLRTVLIEDVFRMDLKSTLDRGEILKFCIFLNQFMVSLCMVANGCCMTFSSMHSVYRTDHSLSCKNGQFTVAVAGMLLLQL